MTNLKINISMIICVLNKKTVDHSGRRRILLQILDKGLHDLFRAMQFNLHTVRVVQNPTRQKMLPSQVEHGGSEAHALHNTSDV